MQEVGGKGAVCTYILTPEVPSQLPRNLCRNFLGDLVEVIIQNADGGVELVRSCGPGGVEAHVVLHDCDDVCASRFEGGVVGEGEGEGVPCGGLEGVEHDVSCAGKGAEEGPVEVGGVAEADSA